MGDDLGREAMALVADGLGHATNSYLSGRNHELP
jgi:hypothetical protein